MSYHVGREGQPLGEFTEQEIREGFQRGTFLITDLTWSDGMPDWRPLDQVFGFASVQSLSAPMTALGPSAMGAGIPMTSEGDMRISVMPVPSTAIASLVLGLLSLATCYFGIFFAIPGVICGHLALSTINRSAMPGGGRSLAIAGLVMNYLWLVLAVIVLVAVAIVTALGLTAARAVML